jgi:hypothetical protein
VYDNPTCLNCNYWAPEFSETQRAEGNPWPEAGRCRRYPPFARDLAPADSGDEKRARYVRTTPDEWCGEWVAREAAFRNAAHAEIDEAERTLRNTAAAQALLVLPKEKQDKLIREILTDEEMQNPCPPDDFHERIIRYFQLHKEVESE